MKWHNLRTFDCPHCEEKLENNNKTKNIECTQCEFVIHQDKFLSIVKHRGAPLHRPKQSFKWQNLKQDRCPLCGDVLHHFTNSNCTEFMECHNEPCEFKITTVSMNRMLEDPEHPCNVFDNGL